MDIVKGYLVLMDMFTGNTLSFLHGSYGRDGGWHPLGLDWDGTSSA